MQREKKPASVASPYVDSTAQRFTLGVYYSMLLFVGYAAVLAYPVLQIAVIWRARGFARLAAGLPLVAMIPIVVITVVNYYRESNLWPILLIFGCPLALLYVCVVFAIQSATSRAGGDPPHRGSAAGA